MKKQQTQMRVACGFCGYVMDSDKWQEHEYSHGLVRKPSTRTGRFLGMEVGDGWIATYHGC